MQIYGLLDPITQTIRYVGKSNDARARLKSHIGDAFKDQKKNDWILELHRNGYLPELVILQEVTGNGNAEERAMIQAYSGNDLLNSQNNPVAEKKKRKPYAKNNSPRKKRGSPSAEAKEKAKIAQKKNLFNRLEKIKNNIPVGVPFYLKDMGVSKNTATKYFKLIRDLFPGEIEIKVDPTGCRGNSPLFLLRKP